MNSYLSQRLVFFYITDDHTNPPAESPSGKHRSCHQQQSSSSHHSSSYLSHLSNGAEANAVVNMSSSANRDHSNCLTPPHSATHKVSDKGESMPAKGMKMIEN